MSLPLLFALALAALAGCKKKEKEGEPEGAGRVSVVISVDWEGARLSEEGLAAMSAFREAFPDVPLTHFITPAYYTKPGADAAEVGAKIEEQVGADDEIGLHIHAWRSLVERAGVTAKLSPSFLGSEPLMEFEDGDSGYEVELGAYDATELRKILTTSRALLTEGGLEPAPLIRIGGTVAVPGVLEAARAEGFVIDSSASDAAAAADEESREEFAARVRQVWPEVDGQTQPFWIDTPAGKILEMPFHFADYLTAEELEEVFARARAKLDEHPDRHVFVDILFHQETAHFFEERVKKALDQARKRFPGALVFETKTAAAERVRAQLTPE